MKTCNRTVRLGVEALEDRQLMTGNIVWTAAGGRFTINGDNVLNDVARVSIISGNPNTSSDDIVHVELGHRNSAGQFVLDASDNMLRSQVNEIRFFGNGGNDSFTNDTAVKSSAFGQAGNDSLTGGSDRDVLMGGSDSDELRGRGAQDILVGGSGADSLFGGGGRDVLIGGTGVDFLVGGSGEDILIGGSTAHDSSEAALKTIMAVWGYPDASYQTRIQQLTGAVASGGSTPVSLLRFQNQPSDTVKDDGVTDQLFGQGGQDWFFSVQATEMPDRVLGPSSSGGERAN